MGLLAALNAGLDGLSTISGKLGALGGDLRIGGAQTQAVHATFEEIPAPVVVQTAAPASPAASPAPKSPPVLVLAGLAAGLVVLWVVVRK